MSCRRRSSHSSLVLMLLLACGGEGDGDSSGSASSGGGTDSASSGGSSGTATSATSDSANGTGADDCHAFDDETVGDPVDVLIRNTRDEPVFVKVQPGCYVSPVFTLEGPGGPVALEGPDCGTCQSAVDGNCHCPGAACLEAVLLWLDAGAEYQTAWSGASFQSATLPDHCVEHGLCDARCTRIVASDPGDYTFTATAAATATGCFDEPCACTPTDGWCWIEGLGGGGGLGAGAVMVEGTVNYPNELSLELIIVP